MSAEQRKSPRKSRMSFYDFLPKLSVTARSYSSMRIMGLLLFREIASERSLIEVDRKSSDMLRLARDSKLSLTAVSRSSSSRRYLCGS